MWPQKWNASASPGFTEPPAAAATSAPPRRARKPPRDVSRATAAPSSGTGLLVRPALRSCNDSLELGGAVERALGADDAFDVERESVGAPRDGELLPDLPVRHLVEDLDRDQRIACQHRDRRLERPAQPAAVRRESREGETRLGAECERIDQPAPLADLRPLRGELEGRVGWKAKPELSELPGQREDGDGEQRNGRERDDEAGGEPSVRPESGQPRQRGERHGERDVPADREPPHTAAGAEARARAPGFPAPDRADENGSEHDHQGRSGIRGDREAGGNARCERKLDDDERDDRRPRCSQRRQRPRALARTGDLQDGRDPQDGREREAEGERHERAILVVAGLAVAWEMAVRVRFAYASILLALAGCASDAGE